MRRFCLTAFAVLVLAVSGPAADAPTVAELVRKLETGSPGERVIAAEQLGDLGPAAADAIPSLAKAARNATTSPGGLNPEKPGANDYLYRATLRALADIGPRSASVLTELLAQVPRNGRREILSALGVLGRDASPAATVLARLMTDHELRSDITSVLEQIGPAAEPAIPGLVAFLLDPDTKRIDGLGGPDRHPPPPRVHIARALVAVGPKAGPAIKEQVLPALVKELKDGDRHGGGRAAEVLEILGVAAAPAMLALVNYIHKQEFESFATEPARALLFLGRDGRAVFRDLFVHPNRLVRRAVVEALDRGGRSDSVPVDVAPYVRPLLALMRDEEPADRLRVATILARLGEKAPPDVVAAVAALFRDPSIVTGDKPAIAAAVGGFYLAPYGDAGIRALIPLLDSTAPAVRKFALDELRSVCGRAESALPGVRKLVSDPDPKLAINAAYTAARISLDPKDVAPLIDRRFLRHPDPKVRADALFSVELLGPLALKYEHDLIPLLDDQDEAVRTAAARAVSVLGPRATAAARSLFTRNLVPKEKGGFGLEYDIPPGPSARDAVPVLIEEIKRGRDEVWNLYRQLGSLGPVARDAVPLLADKLRTATEGIDRWALFEALGAIGPDAAVAVPVLVPLLTGQDRDEQVSAAVCLGDIGPAAKAAIPELKRLLTDPNPTLRFAAGYALARVENDWLAFRPTLVSAVRRAARGSDYPWMLPRVFERSPPDSPELIPLVSAWLERGYWGADHELIGGLAKYGPKAAPAVSGLRRVLRDTTVPAHRVWVEIKPACDLLGVMGPDAKAALPELRMMLDWCGDIEVALAARDAIRKIKGEK